MAYNGMQITTGHVTDNAVFEMMDGIITELSVTTARPGNESKANVTNNGTNSTGITHLLDNFHFYQAEEIVFLSFLLVCIVLGNSIVLLAVGLSRRRHSRMHFFIMHLALADLSVGLVTVLGDLIWKITVKWYAGDVMCKLVKYAQAFVMFASTYMLVALSIDRYIAIARPLKFSTTWMRCKVLVAIAWGLSALFATPLLFVSSVEDGSMECWMSFPEQYHWIIYFLCVMAAVLVFPAVIITACYTLIIAIIWKHSRLLASTNPKQVYTAEKKVLVQSSQESSTQNVYTPKGASKPNRANSGNIRTSNSVIPQAKIRTVKMTFTIVTAFIICWSPYFVFNLLHLLGYVPNTQKMLAVATFIQNLAPLNSAANPVIYGIFSTRICRYLRQLRIFRCISRLFCCQDGPTPRSFGFSDFSNTTDTCGDHIRRSPRNNYPRRSPRNSEDFLRKSPRSSRDFLRKSPRPLESNDYTRRSPRFIAYDEYSNKGVPRRDNNIEMCDFILITVQSERNST